MIKAVSEKDKLKQKIKNNSSKISQKAKGIEVAIKAKNQKRN